MDLHRGCGLPLIPNAPFNRWLVAERLPLIAREGSVYIGFAISPFLGDAFYTVRCLPKG